MLSELRWAFSPFNYLQRWKSEFAKGIRNFFTIMGWRNCLPLIACRRNLRSCLPRKRRLILSWKKQEMRWGSFWPSRLMLRGCSAGTSGKREKRKNRQPRNPRKTSHLFFDFLSIFQMRCQTVLVCFRGLRNHPNKQKYKSRTGGYLLFFAKWVPICIACQDYRKFLITKNIRNIC